MQENVHAGKGACKIGYMQERCMQDGVHAGKVHAGRDTCRKKDMQEGTHKGKRTCRKQQATNKPFSYWSIMIEAGKFNRRIPINHLLNILQNQYQYIKVLVLLMKTNKSIFKE